jgi:hypothetical protein
MHSNWFRLLITVVLMSFANPGQSTAADVFSDSNWVTLFDGEDLTGWTIMNGAAFTVTNRVLHLEKSMGWLRTEKQYTVPK